MIYPSDWTLFIHFKISPMNSKIQRKLQDDNSYEIDGTMFMSLAKMNRTYSDEILFQLDKYEHSLPVDDHLVQVLSGVVIHEEPLFFEISYVKPSDALTLFLTVREISCDEYLDYINLKKSLPQAKAWVVDYLLILPFFNSSNIPINSQVFDSHFTQISL